MLSHLKWIGAGLLVCALIAGGWYINGWRIRAAQADVLQVELRNELQRRVAADVARLTAEKKLQATELALAKKLNLVIEAIRSHDPKSPECDVPDDVAGQLSKLRQGN